MLEPEHLRITRVVGERVRTIRRERGISQQDLADLAALHATNIGQLERGKGNPKLDTLARIAMALDTSVADLVQDVTTDVVEPKVSRRITAKDLIEARGIERDKDERNKDARTKVERDKVERDKNERDKDKQSLEERSKTK